MKIQTVTSSYGNDFRADYVCEHCGHVKNAYGYNDAYFHNVVIPGWSCEKCGLRRNGTPGDIPVGSSRSVRPDAAVAPTDDDDHHQEKGDSDGSH